jgi:hypothetical protein
VKDTDECANEIVGVGVCPQITAAYRPIDGGDEGGVDERTRVSSEMLLCEICLPQASGRATR